MGVVVVEGQLGDAAYRLDRGGRRRGCPAPPRGSRGTRPRERPGRAAPCRRSSSRSSAWWCGSARRSRRPGRRRGPARRRPRWPPGGARRGCGRRRGCARARWPRTWREPSGRGRAGQAAPTYVLFSSLPRRPACVRRSPPLASAAPSPRRWRPAAAGFDGIEVFEPDLVTAPQSPEEIRALADRLGITLDLFQPFRDAEGVDPATFAGNVRRAEAKFRLMRRLGMDTMLVCSNVGTASVDDDHVSAAQLRELGDLAAGYGVRLAFEALAWGRYVDDYRRAWRSWSWPTTPPSASVSTASTSSPGARPEGDRADPRRQGVLPPARRRSDAEHGRAVLEPPPPAVPGEGSFALAEFLAHVLRTGYDGPLSLEVFNDTFRQTDPDRTARQALRSLRWLEDQAARQLGGEAGPDLVRLPDVDEPADLDFVEVKAEDAGEVEVLLRQLGFTFRAGTAASPSGSGRRAPPAWSATSSRPGTCRPRCPRSGRGLLDGRVRGPRGAPPRAPGAPADLRGGAGAGRVRRSDGTEIFLGEVPEGPDATWTVEFEQGRRPTWTRSSPTSTTSTSSSPGSTTTRRCCSTARCWGWSPGGLEVAGPSGW